MAERNETGPTGAEQGGSTSISADQPTASFEELAMPLLNPLYNFARWLTHDQDEAEDLVQETYLKALRNFASFQQGTNFRAWMFTILKNTLLNSRSSPVQRKTESLEGDEGKRELAIELATPEIILLRHFNVESVREAIDSLPPHHREVLLLCDVEEISYREIAEVLSIPIGTVMSRLSRARAALRASLEHTLHPRSLLPVGMSGS